MLECVINISEGRNAALLAQLAVACGPALLDLHSDPYHHRSVFTLGGRHVENAARALTTAAVANLDLRTHAGVHPRIGVVDVVPFVPLPESDDIHNAHSPLTTMAEAITARDHFAHWAAKTLAVPSFFYGPERSLPQVRKYAFTQLFPDIGGSQPHPTAGAMAVGARNILVAYNLWLATPDLQMARVIAKNIRGPHLRALGLQVGHEVQVSCNLIKPMQVGPAQVFDAVARHAKIARAELVGLIPQAALQTQPRQRWAELDLDEERTIEALSGRCCRGT